MSGDGLPDIRDLDLSGVEAFLISKGEQRFRAGQVFDWLWNKKCSSFDGMSNIPKSTRLSLSNSFSFHTASPVYSQESADGTVKTGFQLYDGLITEGVLIPSGARKTLCLSSQVGCAMGCTFCATGMQGFSRNLTAGEIIDQLMHFSGAGEGGGMWPSNIVFMGMGEPFLNYREVTRAIAHITSPGGLGISPQRVTVSSVGIPKMIRTMADDDPKYHFALSLHAATDAKRNLVIPLNRSHPLAELSDALVYYHTKTGKRFTIEYLLLGSFNDSDQDARDLATFCKRFPVKVNILPYNPVAGTGFKPADASRTSRFISLLEDLNMVVNLRQSRGKDIDAACGQLAARLKKTYTTPRKDG
jgi:23S rRNA (adenine2503-C2)-methyltransferase